MSPCGASTVSDAVVRVSDGSNVQQFLFVGNVTLLELLPSAAAADDAALRVVLHGYRFSQSDNLGCALKIAAVVTFARADYLDEGSIRCHRFVHPLRAPASHPTETCRGPARAWHR